MKKIVNFLKNRLLIKSKPLEAIANEKSIIERNIRECKDAHDSFLSPNVPYYKLAEPAMYSQWIEHIYPNIKDFHLEICLELAPGQGRNTNMLKEYAKEIHLVDVNESCIDACRKRFGDTDGNCHFFYYVNDGHTLKEIQDDSMTCLYSWDAVVHFDKLVVRDYTHEFSRVLRSGSYGFVHHSNYGTVEQHNEWMKNPGWRSNMTAELFQEYCNEAGLLIVKQETINDDLDCISVFQKP